MFCLSLFVKVKQCSSCSICRQIAIKLLCKAGFKLYAAPVFLRRYRYFVHVKKYVSLTY